MARPAGPPPLVPFGLVLHHDGHWTHEGQPVRNRRLRALFDKSVRYLTDERKYVVQVQHYRGEIEVEEAGFFVREFDPESGEVALSDGEREVLDISSLRPSARDGALLCRVKFELAAGGLPARFSHAAQAEFMNAVEAGGDRAAVRIAGRLRPLPPL
ncbi:MAG: DUF1285 domain-containing protein [Deltaproteobacteria bacterium]|nr:DUF1285 domain-containing protein [Deltaproteobacteria bacterium]MBW2401242.1 DUF1285 domain-containing protein [Deltaproteobacteria bacterium]MBW2667312.1 DUF1285 domain-containing protein [Deltaproteobacteria bacterium]